MGTTSLSPRKRPRRTPSPGPRLRFAAPLPPCPLRLPDVAYTRRHTDWPRGQRWPDSRAAEPFTAADLTPAVRAGLLARAGARLGRLTAASRITTRERFWLRQELRLALLGGLHPNVVRRWRGEIVWRLRAARDAVEAWSAIEAVLLEHEPSADAWLRRQLAGLAGGRR